MAVKKNVKVQDKYKTTRKKSSVTPEDIRGESFTDGLNAQQKVEAAQKKAEGIASTNKPSPKLAAIDALLNLGAMYPNKGSLSPSMEHVLFGGEAPRILIVKSSKDSIVNKEEFKIEMARFGFKVVFLEHKLNLGQQPVIERIGI